LRDLDTRRAKREKAPAMVEFILVTAIPMGR
jgi:hypothetical protein